MVDPIVLPVTMTRELPRFVIPKDVAGRERYYWTLPSYYRKLGCTLHKEHETALVASFSQTEGIRASSGGYISSTRSDINPFTLAEAAD